MTDVYDEDTERETVGDETDTAELNTAELNTAESDTHAVVTDAVDTVATETDEADIDEADIDEVDIDEADTDEADDIASTSDAEQTTLDSEGEIVLDDDRLRAALEAVLLVVDSPVSTEELATAVDQDRVRVRTMLTTMAEDLTAAGSGFDLRYAGDGWRFYTRADYAPYVERLLLDGARSKLTRAALETLAVIAYRQPVSRARVSAIRGVNVDGVIRTLVARGLINEVGADPQTNATTYGTTEMFLERLGLASLGDLPDLAPLLPDVDIIDDLDDELLSDPRFAKLGRQPADSGQGTESGQVPEADSGNIEAPTPDQE